MHFTGLKKIEDGFHPVLTFPAILPKGNEISIRREVLAPLISISSTRL